VRQTWTGCILLLTALSGSAATLGRHSGAAVIGQPLDVRVQVLLAPGEDLTNQCINADVFYGDAQLSPGLVRSSTQRNTPDAEASVRIQATLPINEPIVTLYVRAGCDTAFTRRFVLLADPINEPAASASKPPAPAAVRPVPPQAQPLAAPPGTTESPVPRPVVPPARNVTQRPSATGQASPPTTRRASDDAVAGRPNPARAPSVVRKAAPAAAPRLQLDPIELDAGIERSPTLKLSPSLLSEPNGSEEARAAAGLLWKAINASPEDILRDAQKLAALEAEASQLRATQAQTQSSVGDLTAQLAEARDQRYRNWLVYLLGAMLLLALLGLLLALRRRPAAGADARAWWSAHPEDKIAAQAVPGQAGSTPSKAAVAPRDEGSDIDLNLDQDSSLDDMQSVPASQDDANGPHGNVDATGEQPRERRDFSPSALGVSRSVATEELFDVQQQADFFVSLGEDEQAIQVLRNHLAESHEPSPLAYLDLFKLYHRLGRREDYTQLRDEFNHVFNAGAPPFDHYTDSGRGLEAYEAAFSRIQSLWPEPRVLDLIEESIFRDATDDHVEVFDLEAYRELLLLHAIAKELITRNEALVAPRSEFRNTSMQPLKAHGRRQDAAFAASRNAQEGVGGRNTEPMPLDALVPMSSHLGLDINLNDLSEFSAFEASLPEVSPPVEPTAKAADVPGAPLSNLIDFEVLDFMPPDEPGTTPDPKH
jgi:hypothetical protein